MKSVILGLAMTLSAVPAVAQTAPVTTPAPVAPAAKAGKFTLDTPIATIVADPAGKAVIDKDVPGTTTHPMYEQFKTMSLNQLAPMASDKLTPEVLARVGTDLSAIK